MPQESKVSWAKLRVGIMTIVAMLILGYLLFLISGTQGLFKSKSNIYTFMGDSSDLADGAPVRLNGIVVGKVSGVHLSGSSDPRRIIRIDLQIDNDYMKSIPKDSGAKISTGNLLGTKYINITKGKSSEIVKSGAELQSSGTAELEDLFQQGGTTLAALQETIKKVDAIIDSIQVGQGTIGKLLVDETLYNKLLAITDGANKLVATLNSSQGTIPRLLNDDQLYKDFSATVGRVNNLMDGLEKGEGTAGKFLKDPAMYDNANAAIADVRKSLAQMDKILTDINDGKGTVGKILKTDELNDQIRGTIAKVDSLMDKINNGQGTLGMLLNNPALYEDLDGMMRESHELIKDIRGNPKKFLTIRLHIF
jgi:phospholipid/cholesterol/gamma-HCH transport system substrate-binding protein